jgi:hypothetical protein
MIEFRIDENGNMWFHFFNISNQRYCQIMLWGGPNLEPMFVRSKQTWSKGQSFGFLLSKGSKLERSKQNLSQCMGQKPSLYRQWTSGANAFRKEELTSLMTQGLESSWHEILLRQFSQCLQNDHSCHVQFFIGTSALEGRHACESFTTI